MKESFVMMAVATGKASTDSTTIKNYMGVASVRVLAVNPTKEKLSEIYGRDIEKDQVYVGQTNPTDGSRPVQQIRITFICKTDPEVSCNNGIEEFFSHTFFLNKTFQYNKDKTKIKVIDKFGDTAWVKPDELKNNEIPVYANGPARLNSDYRPMYIGEEELTQFIKSYLNIPSAYDYNSSTKVWSLKANANDSECRLDNIEKYFTGDISEIRDIIGYQPNNRVKILTGVRTTEDNKQYQTTYNRMALKNSITNYSALKSDVEERKANGAYANVEFDFLDLHEYVVSPTKFAEDDDPFGGTAVEDLPFA